MPLPDLRPHFREKLANQGGFFSVCLCYTVLIIHLIRKVGIAHDFSSGHFAGLADLSFGVYSPTHLQARPQADLDARYLRPDDSPCVPYLLQDSAGSPALLHRRHLLAAAGRVDCPHMVVRQAIQVR